MQSTHNGHLFHKSSYSQGTTQNCVEVAEGHTTAVRDTQNRALGYVEFGAAEWHAFLDDVKAGRL